MSTTESVESVQSLDAVAVEAVIASLKSFAVADLFKVTKAATAEAEKRIKGGKLEPKAPKEKKATPKQLQKPTKWVRFVLEYSQENGWEEFTVENKKSQEIIEMPASVMGADGKYTYPNGKPMILTHAMSLSKQYWAPKAKEGSRKDLYDIFEVEYNASQSEDVEMEDIAAEPEKPKMVRKTAEEKAAEIQKKKEEKAKEAEAKKTKKATAVPKAAVKAVAAPKKAVKAAAVATPAPVGVKPGPKKKAVVEWTCENDGNVYPWTYKAKNYLRNFQNQVWEAEADGSCGDWAGEFIPAEDRIDESVADPFADEE